MKYLVLLAAYLSFSTACLAQVEKKFVIGNISAFEANQYLAPILYLKVDRNNDIISEVILPDANPSIESGSFDNIIPWNGVRLPEEFRLKVVKKRRVIKTKTYKNSNLIENKLTKIKKKVRQIIYITESGKEILCAEEEGRLFRFFALKSSCSLHIDKNVNDYAEVSRVKNRDKAQERLEEKVLNKNTTLTYFLKVKI